MGRLCDFCLTDYEDVNASYVCERKCLYLQTIRLEASRRRSSSSSRRRTECKSKCGFCGKLFDDYGQGIICEAEHELQVETVQEDAVLEGIQTQSGFRHSYDRGCPGLYYNCVGTWFGGYDEPCLRKVGVRWSKIRDRWIVATSPSYRTDRVHKGYLKRYLKDTFNLAF